MESNEELNKEILNILDKYAECYLNKNLDGLMSLFVSDPDLVAIGTGADEWVKGPNQLKAGFKRDFSQADNIRLFFENLTISAAGKVSWVSGATTMQAMIHGEEIIVPGRVSLVLVENEKVWLIKHLHYSVPSENQEEGSSWPE